MQNLRSTLDKADGQGPGPNHVEVRFIKALPAPVQWLLVHSYWAMFRGAPPLMHWRDAHIWLSPKVPGSARMQDYRPIALGQLNMKLLTGPPTQRITEVLTRHGVVSDWQQGALPGSNTAPPLFMAQQQLQRGRPNYVFSFDARQAFHTGPHGALHLILRHLSVPPEVIDLLLFLQTCARLRIVSRARAETARPHAAWRPTGQPRKPPAVRAPPGPPTPGPGASPAPARRGRKGPHPGICKRFSGSGPHAAALRRGRGGSGCVPRNAGHGAQPPQVRHGHYGGGPGPTATPLPPPGKCMALGTRQRTPSSTWDSSFSRMGSSSCSANTGCTWQR